MNAVIVKDHKRVVQTTALHMHVCEQTYTHLKSYASDHYDYMDKHHGMSYIPINDLRNNRASLLPYSGEGGSSVSIASESSTVDQSFTTETLPSNPKESQ
ncbi:hypothetical protein DINM_001212 [Dirofilaria immitis]|nr:hypothetical protein [Dirofilaria immitis]